MRSPLSQHAGRVRTIARWPALAALLVLLLSAASARADTCQAPPGSAAIEQYCENIPTPAPGPGHGGGSSSSIPAGTAKQLTSKGAGALVALASGQPARSAHRATARTRQPADSGGPLDALGASLAHGDVAGGGMVWVLLAIALALGGAAWLRFRRRPPTTD